MPVVNSAHLYEQEGDLQRVRKLPFRLVRVQFISVDFSTDSELSSVNLEAEFVQERDLIVYTDDV